MLLFGLPSVSAPLDPDPGFEISVTTAVAVDLASVAMVVTPPPFNVLIYRTREHRSRVTSHGQRTATNLTGSSRNQRTGDDLVVGNAYPCVSTGWEDAVLSGLVAEILVAGQDVHAPFLVSADGEVLHGGETIGSCVDGTSV